MAKQTPTNKRSRVIATHALLFSVIGLSFVIIVAFFAEILHTNGVDVFILGVL